jgi:hypothetical protein
VAARSAASDSAHHLSRSRPLSHSGYSNEFHCITRAQFARH